MPDPALVWVVDDDEAIRFVLVRALGRAGYDTQSFETVGAVCKALDEAVPAVIITDIRLPDADGAPPRLVVYTEGDDETLINAIVGVAQKVGIEQVALTGGCFQNRYLTEGAVRRLRDAGFDPLWHQHVPPNDGGLALGQAVWASRLLQAGTI